MKSTIAITILLIVHFAIAAPAQMRVLNNRYLKVYQKGDSVLYKYSAKYKIKIDYITGELFVRGKMIYKETTDSVSFDEILDNKYLVISLFSNDFRISSSGRENAVKDDIVLVSLESASVKYYFHLAGKYNAAGVVKFDEAKGLLTIINKSNAVKEDISAYKKEIIN